MFNTIDMRIGRIMSAVPFLGVRKPAYKLEVDLGPLLGVKKSSAQLTAGYPDPAQLVGRLVVAVVNFAPRSIAGFKSEVLVTGFYADEERVFLLEPADHSIACSPGGRIFTTCPLKETTLLPIVSLDQFMSMNRIYLGRVVAIEETDVILDCGPGIGAQVRCPMPASGGAPPTIGGLNALLLRGASSQEADLLVTAEGSLLTSDPSVSLGTLLA